MTTSTRLPHIFKKPLPVTIAFLALSFEVAPAAISTLWSYDLKFDAAHGFESTPTPTDLEGRAGSSKAGGGTWTGQSVRNYDILQSDGNGGYQAGTDGHSDLTITTRVLGNTSPSGTSTWNRMNATIDSNNGLGVNAAMISGRSRPNDWGVVAYTVSFDSSLNLTARDLSMRLSNVNGDGEIYEWAMVTLGGAEQAPFASLDGSGNIITTIGNYKNTDYSNFNNSSYYNPDGTVKAGGTATGTALPTGKTITQFLAGEAAGSRDYVTADGSALTNRGTHVVSNGWVALDNFMTRISDSAPSDSNTAPPINPRNYASNTEDEVDITGAILGMGDFDKVTTFTIWLGYTDVATAQANGTSKTNADMFGYVSGVKIGTSVGQIPEPSTTLLGGLFALSLLARRKR